MLGKVSCARQDSPRVQQDKHDGSGFLNSHRGDVDRDSSSVSRSKIGVPHAEPSSLNYSLGLGLRSLLKASTCGVCVPLARSTAVASSSNRCAPAITWQSRIRIRPPQLNNWVANQKYPGLISAGRRPKTSACLLFTGPFEVFFEVSDSRNLPKSVPHLAKPR